jgi:hypothetical protein
MLRIAATKAADSAAPFPADLKDANLVVIELKRSDDGGFSLPNAAERWRARPSGELARFPVCLTTRRRRRTRR